MARKPKGTGSVYFRASDQRWIGTIDVPTDGKRKRRAVTGATFCGVLRRYSEMAPVESWEPPTPRLERMREAQAKGRHTQNQWWDYGRRQGWTCEYCGTDIGMEAATKDHRTPVSRGGSDGLDNLAVCCWTCNSSKKDKTEDEYRAWLNRHPNVLLMIRANSRRTAKLPRRRNRRAA